jgi:transposase
VAVAASLLTAAYFILRDEVEYRDLGGRYFDTRNIARAATRLTKRLEALGFQVQLTAASVVEFLCS